MDIRSIPKEIRVGEYKYELFVPNLLRPYKVWFQPMYFKRKVRLAIQAIRGSFIFYMKDVQNNVIGYIHLEKGNARYPWATKKDWIISPYAIHEEFRGMGLGNTIIKDFREVLAQYFSGNVYAVTNIKNHSSIRIMEKNGFKFIGYAKIMERGMRRYALTSEPSDYHVYKMV